MLFEFEQAQNLRVEAFAGEFDGDGVNRFDVFHRNDAGFGDVAEERDFALEVGGDVAIAAAKQNVGLNPDAEHFFDAVLRGLGFLFAGGGDVRNESDVNEERVFCAELEAHLANRFEEGKRLDVADGAADFDDDDVNAFGNFFDGGFDFVGDVRNDLHGLAEIIAAAFFAENGFVDAAGRPVIVAAELGVREALVVAEVEVGFSAVFGDENFAVLKRTHRAGIDVEIRIALLKGDFESATFEETTDGGGSYALSERGNNTAGNKNIFWRHP